MTAPVWITEPGFYPDLDGDRYFEDPTPVPSLNQSTIKTLNSAAPIHAAKDHPRLNPYGRRRDSTRAQWLGSTVHRLALGKGKEISIIRYPDYKTTSAQDARDLAVANGRLPVLERGYADALAMAEILKRQIDDALDGAPYETEVPFFWIRQTRAGPIWCRGMLDVWCEAKAKALDVKTTAGYATEEEVAKAIASNGYDVQDDWYLDGIKTIRPDLAGRATFEFLFCETVEPYGARTFELDETSRLIAAFQTERAAELWGSCIHAREWPSYPRAAARVGTPPWHQRKWSDLHAIEEMTRNG